MDTGTDRRILDDPRSPGAGRLASVVGDRGAWTPPRRRRPVNVRSVALGLAGVVAICGITAYNDYAVNNTNLVGSHLPIGVVTLVTLFVVLVNAPLLRWAPRVALGSHELAVALGMMLVGCALPSVGLFRYLPGHLTSLWYHASMSGDDANVLKLAAPPAWLFPTMDAPVDDPAARGNDPVVRDFAGRIPGLGETFAERWAAVPWRAWAGPAVAWGAFFACVFGAVMCLMVVFRRQWVENERLPFPLASIYLSLIEPPERGRAFNALFRSRAFWIVAAAVFVVHGVNAMHVYAPKNWPEIPLRYDFNRIFAEPPWGYVEGWFKSASIYFMIVGITLFVQTKIAFSLWAFFVAVQAARMIYGSYQAEITGGMQQDQLVGAIIPFGVTILWVARHHLAVVARQMFRPPQPGEPRGRYLPYAAAGWGTVVCVGGMIAWLTLAGMTVPGAAVVSGLILLTMVVLARVVAETGLLYVLLPLELSRPFLYLMNDVPRAIATRTTFSNLFYSRWMFALFLHDTREGLSAFASHALRVADEDAYADERDWRRAVPFTLALALAIVVAFGVSGAAMLYVEYTNANMLDRGQMLVNEWGANMMANNIILDPSNTFVPPRTGPSEAHSRLGHFTFGATLTTALAALRLRYAWWPLHPVGFLLVYSWGIRNIWFSIFVGWLAKVILVSFGGGDLFRRAKPVFLGLIIGEAAAVAFWLGVALVRLQMGLDYHAMRIMPI